MEVRAALPGDRPAAVRVWHAANTARGVVPSAQRVERVREKLTAADAVVLCGWVGADVAAMVLAEPWRAPGRAGPVATGRAHVSMVFVDPHHWGQGLGTALLAGLHETLGRQGRSHTSLWTRESNRRARRLYTAAGYRPTGRTDELATGEEILELERRLAPDPTLVVAD